MPGHESSPYWAAVDFDSEGDEDKNPPPSNRVYLDPWDNDAFAAIPTESPDSSQEHMDSFVGEPISASFYYVPTKTYDSGEEPKPSKRTIYPEDLVTPDYSIYGRRTSNQNMIPDCQDMPIYGYRPMPERRRSMYIEEPIYAPYPMVYDTLYAPAPMHPYIPPPSRTRMSMQHHPDYVMANHYTQQRRQSRMAEAYDHYAYESLQPEYEDWARPMPKAAPDNFHLSRSEFRVAIMFEKHIRLYDCKHSKIWMVIRHGTRLPSKKDIRGMNTKLRDLKNEIILLNSHGKGSLNEEQLHWFSRWSSNTSEEHEKFLTLEGQDEMILLAERMQKRFPNAIKHKYNNDTFKFKYTATQRTQQSALYFTIGLFDKKNSQDVVFEPALKNDTTLRKL